MRRTRHAAVVLVAAVGCASTSLLAKDQAGPSSVEQQQSVGAIEEQVPSLENDGLFSEVQIRYCLAQILRIDAVRPLLNRYRRTQVDYFNGLVADYNDRCGHYRYEGDALDTAKAWVDANRPRIESDARAAYAKRFPAEPAAAKPSATVAAPAPQTKQPTTPERAAEVAPSPAERRSIDAAGSPAGQTAQSAVPRAAESAPSSPAKPATPAAPPAAAAEPQAGPASPPAAPRASDVTPKQASSPAPTTAASPGAQAPQPAAAPIAAEASPSRGAQAALTPSATPPAPPAKAAPGPVERSAPVSQQPAASPQQAAQTTTEAPSSKPHPAETTAPRASEATTGTPSQPRAPTKPTAPAKPKAELKTAAATAPPPTQVAAAPPRDQAASTSDAALDGFMREIRRIGFQVIPVSASDATAKDGTDLITQIDVKYAAGGYIRSIVVAESSGSATLDEEALTIARGNRYPDVPKELQSRDFAVRFPIVFRPPRR